MKFNLVGPALIMFLIPRLLCAGSVININDGTETDGKLTLNSDSIHIENGGAPVDIKLADVLEADFSDKPFAIDYFSSSSSPNQMPTSWKGVNIGNADKSGTVTYADGNLTLTDSDGRLAGKADKIFVYGTSWTGSGSWTVRLKKGDDKHPKASFGWNLRETLDPGSRMFAELDSGDGTANRAIRKEANADASTSSQRDSGPDIPVWMRFTRNNGSFEYATSKDSQNWDVREQDYVLDWRSNAFIGLINYSDGPDSAQGVFDQFMLKPVSAEPQTLSNGVLLRSGTFLSGVFMYLNKKDGIFNRNGKEVQVVNDQVTAAIYHPVMLHQITDQGSRTGVILKNNDFLEGQIDSVNGYGSYVESLVLGIYQAEQKSILACLVHPVAQAVSPSELRLNDGSIIHATGVSKDSEQFDLHDLSGATIKVDAGEISQFRASGESVQNLIDLPWKTTPPKPATESKNESASPLPSEETWQGPNQEQMIVAVAGSTLDFTLSGKFRALCFRMALSPDSPANAQATCRILSDGRLLPPSLPVKAGDPPRLIYLELQNPKSLIFLIDSVPGARLLILDPVLVREHDTQL